MKRPKPIAAVVYLILMASVPLILILSAWDDGTMPFWFYVLLGITFMFGTWGVMEAHRQRVLQWKRFQAPRVRQKNS